MMTQNRRLVLILLSVGVLLSIPLVAMQFTREVDWNPFDFLVMGLLLLVTGLSCELILRSVKSTRNRLLLVAAGLLAFLLIWAELAVGIFGTPFAGS